MRRCYSEDMITIVQYLRYVREQSERKKVVALLRSKVPALLLEMLPPAHLSTLTHPR